jgi:hypothetical protein
VSPFLVRIATAEIIAAFIARMKEFLPIDEAEFGRQRFALGER